MEDGPMPSYLVDVYQGNNRTITVNVLDASTLLPVNLSGYRAILTVKINKSDSSAVIVKDTDNGPSEAEIGAANKGEILFYLVPADTSPLSVRQYVYDVTVIDQNSRTYTVLEGVFNVAQAVR